MSTAFGFRIWQVYFFYILIYPFIWVVGLGEIAWFMLTLSLFFMKLRLFTKNEVYSVSLFFLGVFVSSFFIKESDRWIQLFREVVLIATFFGGVVYFRSLDGCSAKRMFFATSVFVFLVCFIGGGASLLGWDFDIKTPVAYIVPDAIISTDLGHRFFYNSLVSEAWFIWGDYYRLSSFFLFATSCALALGVSFLLLFFYSLNERSILFFLLLLFVFTAIILTATRSVFIAVFCSISLYVFCSVSARVKILLFFVSIFVFLLFSLSGFFDMLLSMRGGGSVSTRADIYIRTIENLSFFGHGAYEDVSGLPLPLGSHSTYLGILFKYGFLGFIGFFAFFISFFYTAVKLVHIKRVLPFFMFFLVIFAFEEIYLDGLSLVLISIILGLASNKNFICGRLLLYQR